MDPNARFYGAAAEYNKPQGFGFNRRLLTIIGILLVAVLIMFVAIGVFNSIRSAPRANLERLIARSQTLQAFAANNQSKITDDTLSKVTGEVSIYLASDIAVLKNLLVNNYGVSGVSKDITSAEADTTSAKLLADATQSGRFNEAYLEILGQKVASVLQLATELHQNSTGQLKAALEQTISNLQTVQSQL